MSVRPQLSAGRSLAVPSEDGPTPTTGSSAG
jgi:hypothetical protein